MIVCLAWRRLLALTSTRWLNVCICLFGVILRQWKPHKKRLLVKNGTWLMLAQTGAGPAFEELQESESEIDDSGPSDPLRLNYVLTFKAGAICNQINVIASHWWCAARWCVEMWCRGGLDCIAAWLPRPARRILRRCPRPIRSPIIGRWTDASAVSIQLG